jgi:REP element-mobilizing transposase RayT
MSRYSANQNSEFPYHITARTCNRVPFPIPLEQVWQIFEEELWLCGLKYGLRVHCFVLMPNHFHLIASLTSEPIGRILQDLIRDTAIRINEIAFRINHLWGGRTYRCEILELNYFLTAYRYVYQNPVRAGLCEKVEDWPFSTIQGLMGMRQTSIPLVEDSFLFNPTPTQSCFDWLNEKVDKSQNDLIRTALQKRKWKTPKNQKGESLIYDAPFIKK